MVKSTEELAELKRAKLFAKQRIAQIWALLKDKNKDKFDAFIVELNALAKIPVPPTTDAEEAAANQHIEKIKLALFLKSNDDPDQDELIQLLQKPSLDEATIVAELHKMLIAELTEYQQYKGASEDHWDEYNRIQKTSYSRSRLEEWNNLILQWLQKETPPIDFASFTALRAKMAQELKKDIPDLEAFLDYREKRAEEKYLVAERPWVGELEKPVLDKHIAMVKDYVPAGYGKEPVSESAVLLQKDYGGRTGYPNTSTQKTELLRVYNIGFSQDQVLEVFRNFEDNIEITGGHVADGAPNPVRNLKFTIDGTVYGVAQRKTADGKRLEYLKYKESDYVDWMKDPANQAKTHPQRGNDFIDHIVAKYGKRCELSGDDCQRKLDTPQDYFHRPGDPEKAVTVGEGINNVYGQLSHLAGKKDVYTNIKKYPDSSGPGAGANLTNKGGNTNSASGVKLGPKKPPVPTPTGGGDPAISSDVDEDGTTPQSSSNSGSKISSKF